MIRAIAMDLRSRQGMTLIEMLVATAATLLLMGAVAQVFSVFGAAVSNSRAMTDQDARLRTVALRLRSDLAGVTARTLPPLRPEAGEGYLEVIEGPRTDSAAAADTATLAADTDDVLLFTTRSADSPFVGRAGASAVESNTTEVAWFLRPTPGQINPPTFTLYRRQMLVIGYPGFSPFSEANAGNTKAVDVSSSTPWGDFYDDYDISVRREGHVFIPNTLADLTRPESRFLHNPAGGVTEADFPYMFPSDTFQNPLPPPQPPVAQPQQHPDGLVLGVSSRTRRTGEDIVLTNVIAFDVRVFDPGAPVSLDSSGNDALVPGDPGLGTTIASGAYVDLGNMTVASAGSAVKASPRFSGYGQRNYRASYFGAADQRKWDTWSTHYEANGYNDDQLLGVDQGSNGLDDAMGSPARKNGQVDEAEEMETSPPYPFPLRGIEVRIRCYEPSSRQVRQVTVRHTFVPH